METRNKRRKSSLDLSTMVYGKVPPQAKDIEESILGSVMFIPSNYDTVASYLRPECFYVESHQRIFTAIQTLKNRNNPYDVLSVIEELRRIDELEMVGGPYYVTKLTNSAIGSVEHHCRIVFQKFIQREIIRISGELIGEAYEDGSDPFELLNRARVEVDSISQKTFGGMTSIDKVIVEALQEIQENRGKDSAITGIPSGVAKLDRITRGWQPGDMIVIGGRPSKGKTALVLKFLKNAAIYLKEKNKTAKMWSLEMKAKRLILRMFAEASRTNLWSLQTGRLDDKQMEIVFKEAVRILAQLPIYFDDVSGADMTQIRAKAKKKEAGKETGIVLVDYLQLITPAGKENTREQEVSKMSRGMKLLAHEMGVPVIVLSQLSRETEKRNSKVPQTSDLRDSGSIEQDADVVIFIWGPTDEEIALDATLADKIYIRVAKQRDGMLDTIELYFKKEWQLFSENPIEEIQGYRPVTIDYTEKKENPF